MRDGWECVIGLEIHTQLNTKSKIFSGSSTAFGNEANTQASLVDLGFPGVLPVVNREVFRKAVAFGLAVGSKINRKSVFDRKNYFYPDLPKGYQITQLAEPIVEGGSVDIRLESGETRTIRITRAHLEEDAGKSLHEDYHGQSGIDLNRAGTPLIEIVSEPDLRSTEAAVAYARVIHSLVTWLDVSDGDMSQGSFRCDANVSVRPAGETELGTRTEIKNINSFRFLERAIDYEIERQIDAIEAGERIRQETRLYDPDRDETRPMRSKETSMDYRYFPEPDLLPVVLEQQFIDDVASSMPEMPAEKVARFVREFDLSQADAEVLASSRTLADYFEVVATQSAQSRSAANWVRVELLARLNRAELDIGESPVSATALAVIVKRIEDNTISGKTAKQVFDALWEGKAADVDQYIEDKGLKQISDTSSIEPVVDQVIKDNPSQVEQYRGGKTKLLGFFVGQVMKETGGTANPQQVNEIIRARLDAE